VWVRVLGLCYPFGTLLVILGTANHFIIDAVFGALVVAAAFVLQWLLSGHGAYTPPLDAPDFGLSDPPLRARHVVSRRGVAVPRRLDQAEGP
jgi:hypothetical protein